MSYFEFVKNQIYNGVAWVSQAADASFSAAVVIDPAHHEIHEGDHYIVADFTDVPNGAFYYILLVTPNTDKRIHLTFQVATEGESTIRFTEDTVTTADGTSITAYNNRRDSVNTATLTVTHTPTITNDGTQLLRGKSGSGKQVGGEIRGENEWILDQNSKYMIRIGNSTPSTIWASWVISWYEHTDDA